CAKVVTAVDPGSAAASASVQDATIGVLGLPVIKVGVVQSSSSTGCAGSVGAVTIASISVGGIPLNVAVHPGANTTISVLGVTLVLNEQIPVTGADQGLTVNAVHIKALGLLDVVIASSTSDIGNC
ncbi:MAG TPA: choice-of-anchor P family protein, partial [Actinocrinis sp.]|uniref:choice-of-anchor P family protein n=1 Tax=Actinocrinis sp. TaxID=1920516 RepID=UPI002DDCE1F3